ncbi:hypothetical protein [Pelagibacterium montanilacus]|uniref:hypothetical protein n=1 Tax=Pelagibacterium montanilacus TaxID=2185280 RepID=UPI000F8D4493|nr:hypothetical protein [Pelagibacterium montanilacus]
MNPIAKMSGIALLTAGLAGCVDVSMDVEVLSQTEARGTMVTGMSPDMYAMMSMEGVESEAFCEDGDIVETAAVVECRVVEEGSFEDLRFDEDGENRPVFEALGDGRIRVSFPTEGVADEVNDEAGASDPEMAAMIATMFEGHFITLSVSGGEIVETNMETAEDGQSARFQIPLGGLVSGSVEIPAELYAVVQK